MRKLIFKAITLIGLVSTSLSNAQINPKNNFIGLDVSTFPQNTSFNYDSCFALGAKLGMSRVGIYQNWSAIEPTPFNYNFSIMDIANIYYPAHNMAVDLTITPIHTNNLEVPNDLRTTAFDDPAFINRFVSMIDSVKSHMPNVTLSSLVIGSEHDVYLGTNDTLWAQYTNFYNAVVKYGKLSWPGLKIATELTFNGLTTKNTFAQALNKNSDYIGVSYYPLNSDFTVKPLSVIPTDFATLVSLYPSKQLCFYQYGFPSSTTCNSSEALQAEFIYETFMTWDTYASNVRMIDFTWLHDYDVNLVNYYSTYYGLKDPIFLEFLHTLGLRAWNGNGTDKPAFRELQCQAKRRGYNNLNISCITETSDQIDNNMDAIAVFPSPAQDCINVVLPLNTKNAELSIINSSGQEEKYIANIQDSHLSIATEDLANGLYLLVLNGENDRKLIGKFMVSK